MDALARLVQAGKLPPMAHHDHEHHAGAHHDHGHAHHGYSHGHGHAAATGRAFAIGLALNIIYMAVEIGAGVTVHSLALLADAAHNASDVLGLLAAYIAGRLAQRGADATYTYGMGGASILAALTNSVLLLTVTGGIAWEAVLRLISAPEVGGETVMFTAILGVLVNGATALLFMRGQHDLNVRAAFVHMASDAGLAAATVAAGAVIWVTHWNRADPVVSLIVSGVIIVTTWSLLRRSVAMSMNAVPEGLSTARITAALQAVPGVLSVHDLHVWPISTTQTALTAHLVRGDCAGDDALLAAAQQRLEEGFGIRHATLQLETANADCACEFAAEA